MTAPVDRALLLTRTLSPWAIACIRAARPAALIASGGGGGLMPLRSEVGSFLTRTGALIPARDRNDCRKDMTTRRQRDAGEIQPAGKGRGLSRPSSEERGGVIDSDRYRAIDPVRTDPR